jgi:hypothetical protein
MLSVGFEPSISAGERPQTYALDGTATGADLGHNIHELKTVLLVGYLASPEEQP